VAKQDDPNNEDRCAWDEQAAVCQGANSELLSIQYGDVVNPSSGQLDMVDSVAGNVLIEHAERGLKAAGAAKVFDNIASTKPARQRDSHRLACTHLSVCPSICLWRRVA
jgi:hypothetical protein